MADPGTTALPSPLVREWAHRRARWLREMSGPRSLWAVGRRKPLGSIPGYWDWRDGFVCLFHTARLLGRGDVLPAERVYAWHTRSLQAVLEHHAEVFHAAGWPTHSIPAWIGHAWRHPVPAMTPLFDAVSDAYGDDWSPGRTDILPGVDREVLLRAAAEELGAPDPAVEFFSARTPLYVFPLTF